MAHTRGTTPKVPVSLASLSRLLARRSHPFDAIPKPISSSIPQCVAPFFDASPMAFSSRAEGRRSSSSPCFMALGTRNVGGGAEQTHNRPFERSGFAGRSAPLR